MEVTVISREWRRAYNDNRKY